MSTRSKKAKPDPKKVTQAKKQEVIDKLDKLDPSNLLGKIANWNLRRNRGLKHKHSEVVLALQKHNLDDKVAREFAPSQAFNRAVNKLEEEERIIEVVRRDKDEILFQFTKFKSQEDLTEGDEELEYKKETKVLLDKGSGKLICKNKSVLEKAQKELDRCLEERTTSDISLIVDKLFEAEGDLIHWAVGAYFIPVSGFPFLEKVKAFLAELGRGMSICPIPAGDEDGDQSVCDAVSDHLEGLVEDLLLKVQNFTLSTKPSSVDRVAEGINEARIKVEGYALLLRDKSKYLLEVIDQANQNLVERIQGLDTERELAPPGQVGRDKFGCVLESQAALINAALTEDPQSTKEIAEQSGTSVGRVGAHLKHWLGEKQGLGKYLQCDKGKYFLLPTP